MLPGVRRYDATIPTTSSSVQRRLVERVLLVATPAWVQASIQDPNRRITNAGEAASLRPRCQASYAPAVSGSPSSAAAAAMAASSRSSLYSGVRTRPN